MSSPFLSRLGTNYCPQDEELAQIKGLLIEPCLRLRRLDDEIAIMRKALYKLTEERDKLGAYVEAHQALMSPIRRLPLDIIEDIFMACLPTHRNCVTSAQEAPVILGRICSSWRAISLSIPRLWSRLHIVEPTLPEPSITSNRRLSEAQVAQRLRLEVANAWLRRSGECPLSISLESSSGPHMPAPLTASVSPPKPDLFLSALVSFASRWQNIRLVVQPWALETLSRLTENDVPLLKQLEIFCFFADPQCLSKFGVLRGPSLSRFTISGSNTKSSDLPLRWNELTSLSLFPSFSAGDLQTCQAVLDILSTCPKLQTCGMLVHDSQDAPLADSVLQCPVLRTLDLLCLGGTPPHTSGRLLSHLSMPDLQEFRLGGQHVQDPQSVSTADSLVFSLAASPRLETIRIDSDAFTKLSLIDFVRGLSPTVQHLDIMEPMYLWQLPSAADPALDDDVLAALATHCPALQELVIHNCRKVSDEALLRFIISRMPVLRRVEVKFDREREVDIRPSLQPFVDEGLKSTITYTSPPPSRSTPWEGLPDAPTGPNSQPFSLHY